jgi:hypothetical protein
MLKLMSTLGKVFPVLLSRSWKVLLVIFSLLAFLLIPGLVFWVFIAYSVISALLLLFYMIKAVVSLFVTSSETKVEKSH